MVHTHTDKLKREAEPIPSGWEVFECSEGARLQWQGDSIEALCERGLCQALESAFSSRPGNASIRLTSHISDTFDLSVLGRIAPGTGVELADDILVYRDMFYQSAGLWSAASTAAPFPLRYALTNGLRHPLRPPKPAGEVYRRHIPWLRKTITFRTVDVDDDLALFSRWMNDPVVAHFWQEEGNLAHHRSYLHRVAEDKHTIGLIGCFDDDPFGYFEVYWAREDRIAPFYDVADHDRGWHGLVGEERYRGKPYLTAWMPSVAHYIFLADCRTQRIVIEPRTDNHKMIKSLARCGYALLKEFDFPHKRAMLGMLLRERFFSEALWVPRD
mgnify:CR=1 FL=1